MSTVSMLFDNATQSGGPRLDSNGRLVRGDALLTAVCISLFTRRRHPKPEAGRHQQSGWWGDSYRARPIGSLLWTLSQEKLVKTTYALARGYCVDALAWLVEDNVTTGTNAEVTRDSRRVDAVRIAIELPRSTAPTWNHVWEGVRFGDL
jgi:phage gp46-like protein